METFGRDTIYTVYVYMIRSGYIDGQDNLNKKIF